MRGDQHGEPCHPEQPGEDNVGQPVVAEENPAEPHCPCPGDSQNDTKNDADAAGEPPRDEIGHHSSDDGAIQRVTRRKGKGVLVRRHGVAERRSRPADNRLADGGEGEPAAAMVIRISGVRERSRQTSNSVTALAIRVMPSRPPRWVNTVRTWLASGVRIAMTWSRVGWSRLETPSSATAS